MASPNRKLKIPADHAEGLQWFRDQDEVTAASVLQILSALPGLSPVPKMKLELIERAGLDADIAGKLVRALLALATQATYHSWSVESVARAVVLSDDLAVERSKVDAVSERLRRAVESNSIWLTASAADLQLDHERVFRSVRVLTDIRPVFGRGSIERPQAAVITEMLKIEYYRNDEVEQLFVALDREDLDRLKLVVDRAIAKSDVLQRTLSTTGINYFELGEVDDREDD